MGMAGAAGFFRTVGINAVERCRNPVTLLVSQPDILMELGQSRSHQSDH